MTTEKHDPWALLREARDELADLLASATCAEHLNAPCDDCSRRLTTRIDAALAEHADSAQRAVEWETDAFGNDYVKQGNVLSMVAQTLDGNFGWETRTEGYADTEAEAKSAAIAAARGLK